MTTFPCALSPSALRRTAAKTGLLLCLILPGITSAFAQQNVQSRPVARLIGVTTSPQVARLVRASNRPLNAAYAASARLVAVSVTGDEHRLFELINRERAKLGLAPVELDGAMSSAAREHALDMADAGKLNHAGRDGSDTAMRARRVGVRGWQMLGENIAFNQGFDDPVAFAVERWMKSVKHRENIANPAWTHTGLGIARKADGSVYFTQVFLER
ncbi:MAG: CAP domain-containing protein [Pyrinomonadaceae bacterium MAG19_C2-C3]|nr:CAP domain-containing protein [Pyrinomonadaceae bacterium MAG19_C2-C3]